MTDAAGHAAPLGLGEARTVRLRPISSVSGLKYEEWVHDCREFVDQVSGGKIGYVHIPNMMGDGLIAFNTWFYPQLDKEGMVVDTRWNGGGFVSQMILERFKRHLVSFDRARGGGISTYPYRVLNGPFVVMTNEMTLMGSKTMQKTMARPQRPAALMRSISSRHSRAAGSRCRARDRGSRPCSG